MKLDAAHIEVSVTQAHDLPLITQGCDLELGRKTLRADDPGVVASGLDSVGQASEEVVISLQPDRCLDAMKYGREVDQSCAVVLSDSLVSEADAEDRLVAGVSSDDLERKSGLLGYTGERISLSARSR